MILFDLDGTLFTSDGIVSPATEKIIHTCKKIGYRIGFITARSGSKKTFCILNKLQYDFIAFYNGAKIYVENQLIENNVLPYKQAIFILRNLDINFTDIPFDVYQEPWKYTSIKDEIWHMESGDIRKCNIYELPEYDVQRIRIKSDSISSNQLQKLMTSESIFYHSIYGDVIITQKNANKRHATRMASAFFNIPLTHMIAFGDDVNDIGMLKSVGIGVAMGNAVSSLKHIANYVTESNDCNGIAAWINHNLL